VNYFEAAASLKKGNVDPVYLCYGEEDYLTRLFLSELKKALFGPGESDVSLEDVEGETTPLSRVLESATTIPLFAVRKLIVVRGGNLFRGRRKKDKDGGEPADAGKEARDQGLRDLAEYLGNPVPSTCLVFAAGDKVDRTTKAYRMLDKNATVVEFPALKGQPLADWVQSRFKETGKLADRAVCTYLIGVIGNNLSMLASEIDKLANYAGSGARITMEAVKAIVSRPVLEDIFDLTDSLGNGNLASTVRTLRDLLALGEQPIRIVAMVSRQFRLLRAAREFITLGWSPQEAAQKLGIHPFAARKCVDQTRNFTLGELNDALRYCLQADADIKTGKVEPVPAVEMLVARLSTLKMIAGKTGTAAIPKNR